jgi:hypothetical protein
MLLYMNLLDYKLLGIVMILVGVVYLMNRSIKYLKNKVIELEIKMVEDKGDSLRAIKNVENDIVSNENKKKIIDLEEKYKKLQLKSISDNNNLLGRINEFIESTKKNMNLNRIKVPESKAEVFTNNIPLLAKEKYENKELKVNNNKVDDTYDLSDSESEVEEMSDNIAIYSNDNEDNHFSNSDIEELSLDNNSNNIQRSDNTESMIPNVVDEKILEEVKKSTVNLNEEISQRSDNLSNNKKSEESIDNITDLLKLKLNRLQCMAEEDGIDVINIKGKKKTKKELADEIFNRKENKTTKEQNSSL